MLQIKESFNLGSCLDLLAPGGGRLGVESGEEVKKWGQEGHSQHRFIMLLLLFQAYSFHLVLVSSSSKPPASQLGSQRILVAKQ